MNKIHKRVSGLKKTVLWKSTTRCNSFYPTKVFFREGLAYFQQDNANCVLQILQQHGFIERRPGHELTCLQSRPFKPFGTTRYKIHKKTVNATASRVYPASQPHFSPSMKIILKNILAKLFCNFRSTVEPRLTKFICSRGYFVNRSTHRAF